MALSRSPVVVVADDFGMSERVTAAILLAFQRRLISATSIMANMPDFEEACSAAHEQALHGRIGVHLNLSEGPALTPAMRACPRFCDENGVLRWKHRNVWSLEPAERTAIAAEWRAQVQRVVDAGITPSHLDSHHHVHTAWPVGAIAIGLAHEYGVSNLRLSRNCGTPPLQIRLYMQVFNTRLKRAGLARVDHFGNAVDVQAIFDTARGPIEVMTHPVLDADGQLLNGKNGEQLERAIERLKIGDRLVSYAKLRDHATAVA